MTISVPGGDDRLLEGSRLAEAAGADDQPRRDTSRPAMTNRSSGHPPWVAVEHLDPVAVAQRASTAHRLRGTTSPSTATATPRGSGAPTPSRLDDVVPVGSSAAPVQLDLIGAVATVTSGVHPALCGQHGTRRDRAGIEAGGRPARARRPPRRSPG